MAEAKLEVKIGAIEFVGEGTEAWLAEQFKTILAEAPNLAALAPPKQEKAAGGEGGSHGASAAKTTQALGAYLTAKGAGNNQVKRFLVTADWLRQRGATPLSTAAVSKALKDNHQAKLGNPSDCLNQNVSKGLAEKDGKNFYITPDGLKSLGHGA